MVQSIHKNLKADKFILNPYDACVPNKMVGDKQCTLVWYVDDNKISHVNENIESKVVAMIKKRFGKMTVMSLITKEDLKCSLLSL